MSAAATAVSQVRERYFLNISQDYADRVAAETPSVTADVLYQRALNDNMKNYAETSALPFGAASQVAATLPSNVVLQINTSRDATQPLRPCADTTEDEAVLNAAMQRNTSHRLLRLVLTDGVVEIPAFELSTLRAFKGIPVPGQKLLVKAGAEIRNGAIIMTDDNTTLLGGEVQQLKQEFLAHRRQMEGGYQTSGGLEGVPRFQPLNVGQHYTARVPANGGASAPRNAARGGAPASRPPRGRGGGRGRGAPSDRGRGAPSDRGFRGGGRGGRGNANGGGGGGGGSGQDWQHDTRGRGQGRGHYGGRRGAGGRGGGHGHVDPHSTQPSTTAGTAPPAVTAANYPSLW